jgi:hypothetical protein
LVDTFFEGRQAAMSSSAVDANIVEFVCVFLLANGFNESAERLSKVLWDMEAMD